MTDPNIARRIRLSPYRRGMGPTFTLTVYDGIRENDFFGRFRVRAVLTQHENGKSIVLFDRSDIVLSAGTCTDSDQAMREIIGWFSLTEESGVGDEFFADYNAEQKSFVATHAETLENESVNRFGEV